MNKHAVISPQVDNASKVHMFDEKVKFTWRRLRLKQRMSCFVFPVFIILPNRIIFQKSL